MVFGSNHPNTGYADVRNVEGQGVTLPRFSACLGSPRRKTGQTDNKANRIGSSKGGPYFLPCLTCVNSLNISKGLMTNVLDIGPLMALGEGVIVTLNMTSGVVWGG